MAYAKADALPEGEPHLESAEFKRSAHPDRLAGSVALDAGAAVVRLDPAARFDIHVILNYGNLCIDLGGIPLLYLPSVPLAYVGGQISTVVPEREYHMAMGKAVRQSFSFAGYNAQNCFDPQDMLLELQFNRQSEQVAHGIDKKGGKKGAGDATIVHAYASSQTKEYLPASQVLAWKITQLLDQALREGSINGLWPDGKVQVDVSFGCCCNAFPVNPLRAENVIVAAQHAPGIDKGKFKDAIAKLVRSANAVLSDPKGRLLNLIDSRTDIVVNGAGDFSKGGPLADTGEGGGMDGHYASGSTRKYGGGLLVGRDVTKPDFSCQLIARNIALHLVRGGIAAEALVSIDYGIGQTAPSKVSVDAEGCQYSSKDLLAAINKAFDLSPEGIINQLNINIRVAAKHT